jgi:hypothetical protein
VRINVGGVPEAVEAERTRRQKRAGPVRETAHKSIEPVDRPLINRLALFTAGGRGCNRAAVVVVRVNEGGVAQG